MTAQHSGSGKGFFGVLILIVGTLLLAGCGGGGGGGGATGTPGIALSTTSIQFPNTVLGQTAFREVTVQSTGTANLVIGQVAQTTGVPFSPFRDTCSGQTLSPNSSCVVGISFAPGGQATFTDTFTIPSNAGNGTVSVTGKGQGLNVTITDVDTSDLNNVIMIVSVTDRNNAPLVGLDATNFTLFEQGSEIVNFDFNDVIIRPVAVTLDLDSSNSVVSDLANIRTSAKDFLADLNQATDEAAIIKFAREVITVVPFTPLSGNLQNFNDAIDAAYPSSTTATRFFDSVFASIDLLELRGFNGSISAVVTVSDGRDEEGALPSPEVPPVPLHSPISTQTLDSVIAHATQNRVAVYTIGFGPNIVYNTLQRLADETGGLFLETPDSAGLQQAYERIAAVFANQYEIIFTPNITTGTVNLTVGVENLGLQGDDTVEVAY